MIDYFFTLKIRKTGLIDASLAECNPQPLFMSLAPFLVALEKLCAETDADTFYLCDARLNTARHPQLVALVSFFARGPPGSPKHDSHRRL